MKKIAMVLILFMAGNLVLPAEDLDEAQDAANTMAESEIEIIAIVGGALLGIIVLVRLFKSFTAQIEPLGNGPSLAKAGEILLEHAAFGVSPDFKRVFVGFNFSPSW